jgi:hypothetical protein
MSSELTNLLPVYNRKTFRREYFLRLATVVVLMLVVIVIVQAAFLFPSYLYEREIVNSRTLELQSLSANPATGQEQQAQILLASLQKESAFLLATNQVPTSSMALRAVLDVQRPGITLTGFTFGPADNATVKSPTKIMQISGIASTRVNLQDYDAALGALPFVSNADLPISDYAKDSEIPFTITLTGTLAP